jgi:cytochrome P450
MQAVMELYGAMSAEIARRRERPTEDLTTVLIRAEIDGRRLTDPELIGVVFLLLLGGMDTTAGLTGNAFLRIDADLPVRSRT